jgi:hypothetical protein
MSDVMLDLTGANPDEIGFPAIPSGSYRCHVGKAEWKLTDNLDGSKALPHETPYLAIGVRVNDDEEERDNQKVAGVYAGWTNLFVPPSDYDPTKAQSMKNRMANFLKAIGEDYTKKGYQIPAVEDLVGKELSAVVRRRYDKDREKNVNEIEGFKPIGEAGDSSVGGLV